MSQFDYAIHSPVLVTCRHCGWHGREGEDCDCERMEAMEKGEAEETDDSPRRMPGN